MVCDDCTQKLSVISAPDPWKQGSHSAIRKVDENKLLRKGIRSNPYSNSCKICKLKCQQNNAIYCTICAYAKGVCSICGKQVQDTRMYKMSEGGNGWHTVRDRDEKSFKSPDQIAREESQNELLTFLAESGSVGRMPTKATLEAAGKKELASTLVRLYGGLYAAADAYGLSKRFLMEEADEKKEAKLRATRAAAERSQEARAPPPRPAIAPPAPAPRFAHAASPHAGAAPP